MCCIVLCFGLKIHDIGIQLKKKKKRAYLHVYSYPWNLLVSFLSTPNPNVENFQLFFLYIDMYA